MNVRKGTRVGLLFSDGSTIDYETTSTVSLDYLIETLRRLSALDTNHENGSR